MINSASARVTESTGLWLPFLLSLPQPCHNHLWNIPCQVRSLSQSSSPLSACWTNSFQRWHQRASWASERQRQRKHFRGFCVRESRAFGVWPRVEWTMKEKLLRLPGFLAYRATGAHETGRRGKKNDTSRHASGAPRRCPSCVTASFPRKQSEHFRVRQEPGAGGVRSVLLGPVPKPRLRLGLSRNPASRLARAKRLFPGRCGCPWDSPLHWSGESLALWRFGSSRREQGSRFPELRARRWPSFFFPFPSAASQTLVWAPPWRIRPPTAPKGRAQW